MRSNVKIYFLMLLYVCMAVCTFNANAQNDCPANVGFEQGDFSGWECYSGTIITTFPGDLNLSSTSPITGSHTLIPSSPDNQPDFYSRGEINLDVSPNGSNYIMKLGNTDTNNGAESVAYTLKVPDNAIGYSITYNYAVVFFNPPGNNHLDWEQPKFTAKVFDVATNKEIDCGRATFTSSSSLPGFKESETRDIFYKPWSPVTIDLSDYAGKTIRLEFTTNDCAKPGGRHFGYAYLDINEACSSPITGNIICPGVATEITLKAPQGLKEYYWYNDLGDLLGTGNTHTISPAPPVGTTYALRIVPYPGLGGCEEVVYTTIKAFDGQLDLKVPSTPLTACADVGVDLTAPSVTAGSTAKLILTYHTDAEGKSFLPGTRAVKTSGIYYIKGTTQSGCYLIKPVQVFIYDPPKLIVTNPPPVCKPAIVDITKAAITARSDAGLTLSYWQDPFASTPLQTPGAIQQSGTYYIKAITATGCPVIKSVTVIIDDKPVLVVKDVAACVTADLTATTVTAGSSFGATLTYWADAAGTLRLPAPDKITISGTYHIRSVNSSGCFVTAPVKVNIYPAVDLQVLPLIVVNYPETVDLTSAVTKKSGLMYSYWTDELTTKEVSNPSVVSENGIYYVKAQNEQCNKVLPVKIVIIPPPEPKIDGPNTFTPNNDGINDLFKMNITGIINIKYFKVFDRWGRIVFYTTDPGKAWDGSHEGRNAGTGTYYWVFDAYDNFYKRKVSGAGYITLIR